LAVELKTPRACQRLQPQCVQAGGEIGALLFKNSKALTIALGVAFRGTDAIRLFPGVIDLQSQNGKAVDDQAG